MPRVSLVESVDPAEFSEKEKSRKKKKKKKITRFSKPNKNGHVVSREALLLLFSVLSFCTLLRSCSNQ